MTPHEKALEAASEKAYQLFDGFEPLMNEVDSIVKTYLTTLLDSPEMVEKMAERAEVSYFGSFGEKDKTIWETQVRAVIAAIKKEAGI